METTKEKMFDFKRFGRVISRDVNSNMQSLLLKWVMMFGMMTLILVLVSLVVDSTGKGPAEVVFVIGLFLFGALGASIFMENMTTAPARLTSLMLPATYLEKYMSRFVICIIGTTVAYLISYELADCIRVIFVNYLSPATHVRAVAMPIWEMTDFSDGVKSTSLMMLCFYISMQSTFVLGSTFWAKNSFVKTFAACLVLQFALSMICSSIAEHMIMGKSVYFDKKIFEYEGMLAWGLLIMSVICAIFQYVVAYYRIKEAEIIDRL